MFGFIGWADCDGNKWKGTQLLLIIAIIIYKKLLLIIAIIIGAYMF